MKHLLLTTLLLQICCALAPAQSKKDNKIRDLNFLIGTWDVTTTRQRGQSAPVVESGATISFSYDMDSTMIRNERRLKDGTFYELIFYNPSRKMFEFIPVESGVGFAPRPWVVDLKKKSYRYRFLSFNSEKQLTMETTVILQAVGDNELVETFEEIAYETGERQYLNTLRMKRVK